MTAGRKPNNQPATAWDYHRAITLVQVLASDDPIAGLNALCDAWGIERKGAMSIQELAKAALAHGRNEGA